MEPTRNDGEVRRVLLGTVHGLIEGELAVGPQIRTLDYLNRAATRFLPLHDAKARSAGLAIQGGSVSINMATILWVSEIESMRPRTGVTIKAHLNRCAVRFCFADCEVLGFLHTPPQGDPLARLNQERGVFLALTSVSITGAETELAAEFLAVNSAHLFTAEIVVQDDTALEGTSVFEEAGS